MHLKMERILTYHRGFSNGHLEIPPYESIRLLYPFHFFIVLNQGLEQSDCRQTFFIFGIFQDIYMNIPKFTKMVWRQSDYIRQIIFVNMYVIYKFLDFHFQKEKLNCIKYEILKNNHDYCLIYKSSLFSNLIKLFGFWGL